MNAFRCTPDRRLDREYLRVCAIYKLLKRGAINKIGALSISRRPIPGSHKKSPDWLLATIELWLAGPLKTKS